MLFFDFFKEKKKIFINFNGLLSFFFNKLKENCEVSFDFNAVHLIFS